MWLRLSFSFRALLGFFGVLSILLCFVSPVSAQEHVTRETVYEVMQHIARECKLMNMNLDACISYAEGKYPELQQPEVGSIFVRTFVKIYRITQAMP